MLGMSVFPKIHRTLAWTTRSLTCICDLFACVHTRDLGNFLVINSHQQCVCQSTKLLTITHFDQSFLRLLMWQEVKGGGERRRAINDRTFSQNPRKRGKNHNQRASQPSRALVCLCAYMSYAFAASMQFTSTRVPVCLHKLCFAASMQFTAVMCLCAYISYAFAASMQFTSSRGPV